MLQYHLLQKELGIICRGKPLLWRIELFEQGFKNFILELLQWTRDIPTSHIASTRDIPTSWMIILTGRYKIPMWSVHIASGRYLLTGRKIRDSQRSSQKFHI